ncbi:MAG: type 1 glutamine amidotransferase [Candidatus Nanopelagicales bacterium]
MRALFVQQDHVSPVGPVGAQLAARGYDVEEFLVVPEDRFHEPNVDAVFPDPRDYDVIVPMGAPWSVYDESTIGAWILEELTFLRTAHEAGVPVLGICFGGQALASALGGAVERAPEAEVGWYEIDSDAPGLVENGPWFQWHHDRWVAPPGAEVIARTPVAQQAYTIGRSMGVQFHPELTPDQLRGWLDNGGTAYLEAHGMDADALLERTVATAADAEARSRRLVDRFLDQVASRPVG